MPDIYYQTGTGIGVVDNAANVPAGAVIITQAAYDAALADWQDDQDAAGAADQAAAEARFLQSFKAFRAVGMAPGDAQVAARAIGMEPSGFNPVTEPYVPIHVVYQSPTDTFPAHTIAAAAGVFEKIGELDDVVVAEPGTYLVTWTARATSVIPGSTATTSAGTTVGVYKGAALVAGSETMLARVSQGVAATAEPALQVQASGGGGLVMAIAAGEHLSLWAKRDSTTGTHSITSDTDGRCRITATRLSL